MKRAILLMAVFLFFTSAVFGQTKAPNPPVTTEAGVDHYCKDKYCSCRKNGSPHNVYQMNCKRVFGFFCRCDCVPGDSTPISGCGSFGALPPATSDQ